MNLAEYRTLVQDQPLPTPEQVRNFVDYVCGKHSWYKHLPLTPPGVRFCFFLDPCVGMQRFEDALGQVRMREIGREDCFHHAMMPTTDYRRRFGTLAVRDRGAPGFSLIGSEGTAHHETPPGVWTGKEFRSIPSEVQFAGTVVVTGVIHDSGGADWVWRRYFDTESNRFDRDPALLTWPEESGGTAVLQEIRMRLAEPHSACTDFDDLIAPERKRQCEAMRQRAQQVVDLVAGKRDA